MQILKKDIDDAYTLHTRGEGISSLWISVNHANYKTGTIEGAGMSLNKEDVLRLIEWLQDEVRLLK
jgi:hypothetical protein